MNREYHHWWSNDLGREMEMLVFGHDGLPAVVFPTSCGRFYDFEDRGVVGALREKIESGRLQLFCVDSVDAESWYRTSLNADERVARHVRYEDYVLHDVLPLVRAKNRRPRLAAVGCSLGGFHALNMALRYPHLFSDVLSMSGAFDLKGLGFIGRHYQGDAAFTPPLEYLSELRDQDALERLRRNTFILATGMHDQCWNDNERMAAALRAKGVPVQLDVWGRQCRARLALVAANGADLFVTYGTRNRNWRTSEEDWCVVWHGEHVSGRAGRAHQLDGDRWCFGGVRPGGWRGNGETLPVCGDRRPHFT